MFIGNSKVSNKFLGVKKNKAWGGSVEGGGYLKLPLREGTPIVTVPKCSTNNLKKRATSTHNSRSLSQKVKSLFCHSKRWTLSSFVVLNSKNPTICWLINNDIPLLLSIFWWFLNLLGWKWRVIYCDYLFQPNVSKEQSTSTIEKTDSQESGFDEEMDSLYKVI